MQKFIPLLLILVITSTVRAESVRLDQLRTQKDAAIKRATDPIDVKYKAALEKLLKVLTASEELEAALEVKEEIAKPKKLSAKPTGKPNGKSSRLELLREQRKSAIERTTEPILSKYVAELKGLQKTMTLNGRLEEAVEAKNELANIQGTPVKTMIGGGDSELAKDLIGTSWEIKQGGGTIMVKFGDGMFQIHKKDSNGNYVPGDSRMWKMEDPKRRRIRVFWHYGEEVATVNSKMTMIKDSRHVMKRVSK